MARNIIIGIVLLLIVLILWRLTHQNSGDHADVRTDTAKIQNVKETVSETGVVDPWTTVDIKSLAEGTLLQLAVEEGTIVKKGQLIAMIDKSDNLSTYNQALADVLSDQAALTQAKEDLGLQKIQLGPTIQESQETVNNSSSKLTEAQQAYALQIKTANADVANSKAGVGSAQAKLDQAVETANSQPGLTTASIQQAQANVDAAQSTLDENQQALTQLVQATQPQLQAQVQATIDQDKSNLVIAQNNLTRNQALFNQGYIPENTLETTQNQVDVAAAAVHTATANLDTLKSQQAAERSQAEARVANARQLLVQAQAQLRTAQLNSVQNQLTLQAEVAAKAALVQAQATLATSIANRDQIAEKEQEVVQAQATLRQSNAGLTVAQANTIQTQEKIQVVNAAQGKLEHDQAIAKDALVDLNGTTVTAPEDGIILVKYIDAGAIVQSGQGGFTGGTAIVNEGDISKMYVDTSVDEADISQVKVNQKVKITLDAYPDNPIHGWVRKIFPIAAVTSNVTYIHVQVQIDPKDVSLKLRSQMNATCDFLVAHKKNVLAVSTDAVHDGTKGSTVTVIKDPTQPLWDTDNQEIRKVTVGIRGDDADEITSGLKQGETVITQVIQPAASGTPAQGGGGAGGGMRLGRS